MKGSEFKTIRNRLGLTQEEIAEVLGLSGKKTVSNIETDFRNAGKLIVVILRFLDGLPKPKSMEIVKRLKDIGEAYDFEVKRKR